MYICVYGASSSKMEERYRSEIYGLGKILASRGHDLVFGAGNSGAMGAAARGFRDGGGYIKGVVPRNFTDRTIEPLYDDCDELIVTNDMAQRKGIMEDLADAFVVCPGGIGTFDELFEILTLKQVGELNKPIALFNINGYYNIIYELLLIAERENFMWDRWRSYYKIFTEDEVDELVAYLEEE